MNRTRIFQIFIFLILIFPLAGCAAVQPAPTATPTLTPAPAPTLTATPVFPLPEGVIVFEIEPTRKFAGHVYGQGETAIILANMGQGGESQWDPFVSAVDKKKFTVIAFNYLQPDFSGAPQAVLAILARLRAVGYKRVVCMGASLGVSACGAIALEPEMVGLVMIAGPNYGSSVSTTYPKLFIAGADDRWASDTETAYKSADEPKQLVLYSGTSMHGTGLFYSQYRDQIIKLMVDFVNDLP
jgi:hypothetical protein